MADPFEDPVVAEVHAVRARMLAGADGDIRQLMRQVAQRQGESKHRVITRPFRNRRPESGDRTKLSQDRTG